MGSEPQPVTETANAMVVGDDDDNDDDESLFGLGCSGDEAASTRLGLVAASKGDTTCCCLAFDAVELPEACCICVDIQTIWVTISPTIRNAVSASIRTKEQEAPEVLRCLRGLLTRTIAVVDNS